MSRFFPIVVYLLVACQAAPESEHIDNRSESKETWIGLDQMVDASGFTKKSRSHIYGSPFVLISEYQINLDANLQYALVEEEFSHRCGDDAEVSHDYAIVNKSGDVTIARNFRGTNGFESNPGGVVTLQAIVFANRMCRIPKFNFSVVRTTLLKQNLKEECEEQDGMKWDGHACVKGAELLCQEKENYLFIDNKCVARTTGDAPKDLLETAWKEKRRDDQARLVFQFFNDGSGVFGFADDELTIKSGTFEISTDFEIDESHVILRIIDNESLPDNSKWKAGTFHYCRYTMIPSVDSDGSDQLQMNCSKANRTSLPQATSELLEFESVNTEETDLIQD